MALGSIRAPEFVAGARIVGDDFLCARRDELDAVAGADDERRRPAPPRRPIAAPHFPAVAAIERHDERAGAHLLIVLEDDELLEQHRRRPRTHAGLGDAAERLLPQQVAVEVEHVQAGRFEVGVDGRPVGRDCRRRVGVLAMAVVVHRAVVDRPLPQLLAAARVVGQRLERVEAVDADAVGMQVPGLEIETEMVRSSVPFRRLSTLDRRRQEDAIAPDDRRRVAAAGNGCLPGDVLPGRPVLGIRRAARDAEAVRSAPAGPVGVVCGRRPGRQGGRTKQNQAGDRSLHAALAYRGRLAPSLRR